MPLRVYDYQSFGVNFFRWSITTKESPADKDMTIQQRLDHHLTALHRGVAFVCSSKLCDNPERAHVC